MPDLSSAAKLLDRAGADGGRALVTSCGPIAGAAPVAPIDGRRAAARPCAWPAEALELADALLLDTWLVPHPETMPDGFSGIAVSTDGRVWSSPMRELRQAPAAGEERVLAQRNRREELLRASEAAAQAELAAAAGSSEPPRLPAKPRPTALAPSNATARPCTIATKRPRTGQRLRASIDADAPRPRRGPGATRKLALEAQLGAERFKLERAERERAERMARIERLRRMVDAGARRSRDGERD